MHSPGGAASSAPSLGLGGLGGATTASSIFSKTTSAPSITGLGGVDPKTSNPGAGVYTCVRKWGCKQVYISDIILSVCVCVIVIVYACAQMHTFVGDSHCV